MENDYSHMENIVTENLEVEETKWEYIEQREG